MSEKTLFKVEKYILSEEEFFSWLNIIDTEKGILVVRKTFKTNSTVSTIFLAATELNIKLGMSEIFEVMKFDEKESTSECYRTLSYEKAMQKHEEFMRNVI